MDIDKVEGVYVKTIDAAILGRTDLNKAVRCCIDWAITEFGPEGRKGPEGKKGR